MSSKIAGVCSQAFKSYTAMAGCMALFLSANQRRKHERETKIYSIPGSGTSIA